MRPSGILEACLYAEDLTAAEEFYTRVLGLKVHARNAGRDVFFECGQGMFLIFDPRQTLKPVGDPAFPIHGASGPGHVAFRVEADEMDSWKARLQACEVQIEREISWPGGGRSLYFRDPAGNSIELATVQVWHP